jgi:hypothetical protein
MKLWRTCPSILVLLAVLLPPPVRAADEPRKLVFDGVLCERKLALKDLAPSFPSDWSGYTHLVMEMRTSSPQRFGLWAYTSNGPRRIEIQPFGQNVWLRASVPLQYFIGMDQSGTDLASTINRRTTSFWMSIWGPFGDLKSVEAIGFAMQYPINKPTIELRNVHLAKQDEGSQFLEGTPVTDEFGQWAHVDYPRKIKSAEQLTKELTDEAAALGSGADFGYCEYGGYKSTQAKATGFFHVEQIDGKWWFVDPHGHWFLSMGVNGAGGGGGRGGRGGPGANPAAPSQAQRLAAWGMTTGGPGRPNTAYFRWSGNRGTTFLGLPDVYDTNFVSSVDQLASQQLPAQKDNPLILGYFLGNEPPWGDRESEVVDMILKGPDTGTKARLKEFLAQGDTPVRRKEFVVTAFEHYLTTICAAVKKYDPNHLILGIRFGGKPADDVLRLGRIFDVCSINVYEYEPTKQVDRAYRLSGRPILIGEFHIGVPENGLGAGLVQAMNQTERGIGYRYFVEQAASLDGFIGAHWFAWQDEGVTGRMDGENYNLGFVDVTNRPYPELVEAAKATHKRLLDVHSGKVLPFSQKPRASEAGTPSSPWDW